MKDRKYRHELKFCISKNDAQVLKNNLLTLMSIDSNGLGGYFIRSLYFDTPDSQAYYEKLDGVLYRKKYRIRLYNKDDKYIRLEKKLKHNNMTSKDQTLISKDLCLKLINNSFDCDYENNELLKEFYYDMKIKKLEPSVIVDYQRLALTYPLSDVRVTFDYNISSGKYNYNIFDYSWPTYPVIEDDLMVLEVKYNEILPEPIAIILGTIPSCRQAFSKFAACRSIK